MPEIEARPGSEIEIQVFKADGSLFRYWTATLERLEPGLVVTWAAPGHVVRGRQVVTWPDVPANQRDWVSQWGIRTFYWPDRPYNLLEIYHPTGEFYELYVHVASPAEFDGRVLRWTDYELDVVLRSSGEPELLDADEFDEAAAGYGYSPEFQAECYRVAAEAADLVRGWKLTGDS